MKFANIVLFAKHFMQNTIKLKSFYGVGIIFLLLTAYAAVSGIKNYTTQNEIRQTYQSKARQSWEANPDKHPHRMAHFGTFAFRKGHPLSVFDYGLENYTGNAMFLEAHRQNSVNFSEASFSTGVLRFGQLSMATLVQLVLPLILIFIGFSSIASDRENGTLKIIVAQGARSLEIILGKSLGLFSVSLLFFVPMALVVLCSLLIYDNALNTNDIWFRYWVLLIFYLLFLGIVSITITVVSSVSRTAKNALLKLLGIWLVLFILIPRTAQSIGEYYYPTPTKLVFQNAIEKDVIKIGDSHNPDDPYYKKLKDSVLKANNVTKVTELPFNYGGLVMSKGEKISTILYRKHHKDLLKTYEKQNNISKLIAFINPYLALKQLSMTISGTDFSSYVSFQNQAEEYRYTLAQTMNELQINYISPTKVSGSEGKKHVVDDEHWEAFSDFNHEPISFKKSMTEALTPMLSLLLWSILMIVFVKITIKKMKIV